MFEINPYKEKDKKEIGKKGVEANFVDAVKSAGGKAFKFTSEMNRGVSDRIVVFPGQVWFAEVKRAKGKLSPLQEIFRNYIQQNSLNHFVAYGDPGIQKFLEEVKRNDRR